MFAQYSSTLLFLHLKYSKHCTLSYKARFCNKSNFNSAFDIFVPEFEFLQTKFKILISNFDYLCSKFNYSRSKQALYYSAAVFWKSVLFILWSNLYQITRRDLIKPTKTYFKNRQTAAAFCENVQTFGQNQTGRKA